METIEDIVREMMAEAKKAPDARVVNHTQLTYAHIGSLAYRIEAALKRRNEAIHEQWERAMMLDAENRSLRAALKPVLDFSTDKSKWRNQSNMYRSSFFAVSEAHKIYNERMAKQ